MWSILLMGLFAWSTTGPGAGKAHGQNPVTPPPVLEEPGTGVLLDTVIVRGNQRLGEIGIRGLSGLQTGTRITAADVQRAIRRLMSSGNFQSVEVFARGVPPSTLVLDVVEQPFIADIQFRGLERISAGTVRDTVGLRENVPLDPSLIPRTEQMIRNLLARAGVQVLSVDTALTPLERPENSYRLTFEVEEGTRLSIADIEFEGNEAFSDETLRDAIATSEEGFLLVPQRQIRSRNLSAGSSAAVA